MPYVGTKKPLPPREPRQGTLLAVEDSPAFQMMRASSPEEKNCRAGWIGGGLSGLGWPGSAGLWSMGGTVQCYGKHCPVHRAEEDTTGAQHVQVHFLCLPALVTKFSLFETQL